MVIVLCPLFSTRCVGLRIKCSWVPFELDFRRRSRHDPICLRPFEFPFLRVSVNVVTSLFNPSAVVLCSPLARSFVSLRSFSFFNSPASCGFECGKRDDKEKNPRCLARCVSCGPTFNTRESTHPGRVVVVLVGLCCCSWYCPLSTAPQFPVRESARSCASQFSYYAQRTERTILATALPLRRVLLV